MNFIVPYTFPALYWNFLFDGALDICLYKRYHILLFFDWSLVLNTTPSHRVGDDDLKRRLPF